MSKVIKKQLKRSFPAVMILLLLNISIFGVFFNLKFDFSQPQWLQEVLANTDTASSTVTVRNAPPTITVAPVENPISSSTSPVNVGASIGFNVTATDAEVNNYYLIVCSSATATPVNGGAPNCGAGTTFCTSGSTVQGAQASCMYNNVADPSAESQAWYALVCDNHATDAACSLANQGSGESGSPFYVNHAPAFTAAATTVDNRDPGGTFTFQATVSDADTQGANDQMSMAVCSTNSWSTSTGCAVTTLCTSSNAVGPTITCNNTTTAPVAHGAQTGYVFVKDWHNMPSAANSRSTTYTTNDVAPVVSNVTLNNGSVISTNMRGMADKIVVASTTSVTDYNGCSDLVSATSTIYMSGAISGSNCSNNINDCYQIASGNCSITNCASSTATVSCSAGITFNAIPTDESGSSNPYIPYNWMAAIGVSDGSRTTMATSSGVELESLQAEDVSEASIAYNQVTAGSNTGTFNATTTIINFGNVPLNNGISGTHMYNGGNVIQNDNQKFDLSNFNYPAATYTLGSTTATITMVIPRPTTTSTPVTGPVYWGINIPSGRPSGDYAGVNTFEAALRIAGGNWN
jgi:hypothetical protein